MKVYRSPINQSYSQLRRLGNCSDAIILLIGLVPTYASFEKNRGDDFHISLYSNATNNSNATFVTGLFVSLLLQRASTITGRSVLLELSAGR